jgi:predicted metal-dependent hydrolase
VARGSLIPFLGVEHAIEIGHTGIASVSIKPGNVIRIDGSSRHAERQLREFLKIEAKRVLEARSFAFAARIGASVRRVGIRDAKGRWGSCSRRGTISYSWRLILAPPFVLDYVVAHEVAHLREMHHGTKFWAIVRALVGECREARLWLRRNGVSLHRYLTSQAGS